MWIVYDMGFFIWRILEHISTRGREYQLRNLPLNSSFHLQDCPWAAFGASASPCDWPWKSLGMSWSRVALGQAPGPQLFHYPLVNVYIAMENYIQLLSLIGKSAIDGPLSIVIYGYGSLPEAILYRICSSKKTSLLFSNFLDGSSSNMHCYAKEWFAWKCPCPPKQLLACTICRRDTSGPSCSLPCICSCIWL